MAKAASWTNTDAEVRKCGEQTGLDTYAFVSECQEWSSMLPSLLVFLCISTDFTPTCTIPHTSPTL